MRGGDLIGALGRTANHEDVNHSQMKAVTAALIFFPLVSGAQVAPTRAPMLDTTAKSIEEIATTISYRAKLRRHIY